MKLSFMLVQVTKKDTHKAIQFSVPCCYHQICSENIAVLQVLALFLACACCQKGNLLITQNKPELYHHSQIQPPLTKRDIINFTSLAPTLFAGSFMQGLPSQAEVLKHSCYINKSFLCDKTIEGNWLISCGNNQVCSLILQVTSIWACDRTALLFHLQVRSGLMT